MVTAIVLAAGSGERMGGVDKPFLSIGPKPMLAYSLIAMEHTREVDEVIVVTRGERIASARGIARMFGATKVSQVIAGGRSRQESVMKALAALHDETPAETIKVGGKSESIVVIHDAARPLVKSELIVATIHSAQRHGSGVAAAAVVDTIKLVRKDGATAERTLDRARLRAMQTPQTFKTELIKRAYDAVAKTGVKVTDDAAAVEFIGESVRLVEWNQPNLKVTYPDDLAIVAAII